MLVKLLMNIMKRKRNRRCLVTAKSFFNKYTKLNMMFINKVFRMCTQDNKNSIITVSESRPFYWCKNPAKGSKFLNITITTSEIVVG